MNRQQVQDFVGFLLCFVLMLVFVATGVGFLANHDDELNLGEAALAVGTHAQQRTERVFDEGAVYGYRRAIKDLDAAYSRLIPYAIKQHDAAILIKAKAAKKHHKKRNR